MSAAAPQCSAGGVLACRLGLAECDQDQGGGRLRGRLGQFCMKAECMPCVRVLLLLAIAFSTHSRPRSVALCACLPFRVCMFACLPACLPVSGQMFALLVGPGANKALYDPHMGFHLLSQHYPWVEVAGVVKAPAHNPLSHLSRARCVTSAPCASVRRSCSMSAPSAPSV
jgi:hypothetical protein